MKYNNVEFLLVDDGSTDGSSEICDRYGTRDSRFHVFHIKNRGVAGARNYGISRASGDYLLFVDSDDYVEKTYCEKIESAILREDPDVIVFAGIEENGREKEQLTVPFSKKRVVWNGHDFLLESYKTHSLYYQVWMYAYRREYIQKYDLRFVEGIYHEDVEFTPRALLNAKKILVLNNCLYHYRVRDGSISNLADKTKNIEDLFNVLRMQIKLAEGQEPRLRKWMLEQGLSLEMLAFFEPRLDYFAKWWIQLFAERTQRMFGFVRELLGTKGDADFNKLFSRIEKYEGISDNMEIEIAKYLDKVSDAHLSDETKAKIRAMLREISEIESIGDSCYNIARTLSRKERGKEDFTERQYEHLHQMFELTDDSLTQMNVMLGGRKDKFDANRSFNIENEINNYRNQLRSQNINDVNAHEYTYAIGTMYMDIISECEKLGDYVINVVEARMGTRQKDA